MMDDVGGKRSDGFLRITVHLSPEQLQCVLPKGPWVHHFAEGMGSEHKLQMEEPTQQQQQRTHALCAQRCSSYHCIFGGLTHNYSVMSNQTCNHAVVIAAAIAAYTTKQRSSQHIDCIYAAHSTKLIFSTRLNAIVIKAVCSSLDNCQRDAPHIKSLTRSTW